MCAAEAATSDEEKACAAGGKGAASQRQAMDRGEANECLLTLVSTARPKLSLRPGRSACV